MVPHGGCAWQKAGWPHPVDKLTSTLAAGTPCLLNTSIAPSSSCLVTRLLKRATTTANFQLGSAVTAPTYSLCASRRVDARPATGAAAMAMAGLVIIFIFALAAVAAPVIAPYNPSEQFFDGLTLEGSPLPPNARSFFDSFGTRCSRDGPSADRRATSAASTLPSHPSRRFRVWRVSGSKPFVGRNRGIPNRKLSQSPLPQATTRAELESS